MTSQNNSALNEDKPLDPSIWEVPLLISHITNIGMLSCSIWVWLSLILYGTKSGRWRHKPSSSSLSSGLVYITCTAAVGLMIVRFSTTEVLFNLPNIQGGLDHCELICDIDNAAYALATFAAYCFLWVRLRLIYNHPYVKKRIGRRANLIRQIGLVVITLAAIALCLFYVIPKGYNQSPLGCVYDKKKPHQFLQGTRRNILIAVALIVSQTIMIYLCVYPAVRVDFNSIAEADTTTNDHGKSMCQRFHSAIINTTCLKSPIQLAVRRTLISCFVMVIANVIVLIPAVIFIPRSAPAQIRRTVYNVGTFINVFCVLATLGFAIKILTLFFPSCPKRKYMKSRNFCREESVLSTTVPVELPVEFPRERQQY